ncbi:restriction endonuclease subunit S [Staphylococcus pseudintermedius]|nr:restriction endonuclease subunit S [Staphylococcus pseudintermedius]
MEYKVENLIDSVSKKHTFPGDKIIFLNTSDIEKGYVLHNNYSMIDSLPGQAKKSIQKGDILYSEIRPKNERFAYINFASDDYVVSTKLMVLRNKKPEILNTKYFYLYITSKKTIDYLQNLAESRSGTFPQITFSEVKNMVIDIPTLAVQNKIVNSIESIDKKIELNKKMIANLEELSQTLFKRWFVDLEFPDESGNPYKSSGGEMIDSELGKIPRGWEIITINDFANNNVITGKTPSTKIKENYSKTGVPFLTIPDMHNDIFALNTERYISELGIEKLIKKVLPKNSLSISCIATPGLVCIIANDTLTNQQINSFTPNKNALYYLYFKLKSMKDYIRDLGSGGSTTLNLNKTQFSKIKLVKPINEILYKYDKLVSPNFKMILNIQKEIQQLTQLRDTLLPKLMSGEIEMPEDIEVNEDELSI